MKSFVSGTIPADDFKEQYLEKFKKETRFLDESTYQLLEEVFGDVDAFEGDDSLRCGMEAENPGWGLDESQLKDRVRTAVTGLSRKT